MAMEAMGQSTAGMAFSIDMPDEITGTMHDYRPLRNGKWEGTGKDLGKFCSSCEVNGQVVAVPCNADKALLVDPSSKQAIAIDLPSDIEDDSVDSMCQNLFCSSCAVNCEVVAAPCNALKILLVDPASHQAFAIDLPVGIRAHGGGKFLSSCVVNDQVVAVPMKAEKILLVDPQSREAFAIDLPSGVSAHRSFYIDGEGPFLDMEDGEGNFLSCCSVNGRVVAVPCDAKKILLVDPTSQQASTIDLPPGITAKRRGKFCCSCTVNGKVVAVPYNAEKVLVVDPASSHAFAVDLPGMNLRQEWTPSYVCSANGYIVFPPFDSDKILVLAVSSSGSRPLTLDLHSDVHTTPQFSELAAAMLSFWIYTENRKPLEMKHARFEVHNLLRPLDLGKSMKIAMLTAHLPVGKVLFVVFRGTTCLLDFGRWNLDDREIVVGDEGLGFFAHGGATEAMEDMVHWKSRSFVKRLEKAKQQGVQSVAFVGHSLGGMYAQLCFLWAWRQIQLGNGLLASFGLQCITFGAPMVFGGTSQKAQDFKDFAKGRAVNYIHGDDPCPRAWGALNLRNFIQQGVAAVKGGLQDTHGSLKGRFTVEDLETLAVELLERPDFNVMEEVAQKYEHFVPLRVLSTKKHHVGWKEFELTTEGFGDHSIVEYVNKMFDAFDDTRPECHIHAQISEPVFQRWRALLGA